MKKTPKKLVLAKETVQNLGDQEMKGVAGEGSMSVCQRHCDSWYYCTYETC